MGFAFTVPGLENLKSSSSSSSESSMNAGFFFATFAGADFLATGFFSGASGAVVGAGAALAVSSRSALTCALLSGFAVAAVAYAFCAAAS